MYDKRYISHFHIRYSEQWSVKFSSLEQMSLFVRLLYKYFTSVGAKAHLYLYEL